MKSKEMLLICAGLVTGLLLCEALLRLLIPGVINLQFATLFKSPLWESWADPEWANPPDDVYSRESTLSYENAAYADALVALAEHAGGRFRFHTNNLGLRRNADVARQKPSGTIRVLILGDSQTAGYVDNDESFASLLESALPQHLPHRMRGEVLNGGVVGYASAQEFLWYKVHGRALEPDVVILVFYAGNDVVESEDPNKPGVDLATGRGVPPRQIGAPDEIGPGRFMTPSQSRFEVLALARWTVAVGPLAPLWQRLHLPGRLVEAAGFSVDALTSVLRSCHGCFWQNLQQSAFAQRNPERMHLAAERTANILIALNREVRKDGHVLLVGVLPSREQVEPKRALPELELAARRLGIGGMALSSEGQVLSTVLNRLQTAKVPVFSPLDELRQAAKRLPQYYDRDWHLNAHGHRTMAAALEQELVGRSLLPRSELTLPADRVARADERD